MGLFSYNYAKDGPGVRKDEPEKKGFARFWEIIMRDYVDFLKANLLFLLCGIPMMVSIMGAAFVAMNFIQYLGMWLIVLLIYIPSSILLGPAMTCLHRICLKAVRNQPCYMWHEFKRCWKENWKQSAAAGLIFHLLLALSVTAVLFYLRMAEGLNIILLAVAMLGIILLTSTWVLTSLQILYIDLPVRKMIKNGFLLTVGYFKRTIPSALITLILLGGFILLIPIPFIPFPFLLGLPAILVLINDMWCWPVMDKVFKISDYEQKKREKEEAEAQAEAARQLKEKLSQRAQQQEETGSEQEKKAPETEC